MNLYRIVDRRAAAVLRATAGRFTEYLGFVECDGRQQALPGHALLADTLSLEQRVVRRLFGRLYCLRWQASLALDLGSQPLQLRLRHRGWSRRSLCVQFDGGTGGHALAAALNADAELLALCRSLELVRLTLRYDPVAQRCDFELRPSYGDYVWVLLPPLNYVRQPTPSEVSGSVLLIERLCRGLLSAARSASSTACRHSLRHPSIRQPAMRKSA